MYLKSKQSRFSYYQMSSLIIAVFLLESVIAGEHILRLQDGIHSGTTTIEVEEGSSVLIRCEHPNGKVESLRWLHSGTAINKKYVKTKLEASYIEIKEYNIDTDDGVYECSSKGMSASYRLKGEKKHILPQGFRYCFGEELANCEHADFCQVEISSQITSCVCEQGWMGATCNIIDTVRTHSVVAQSECSYWPRIVTFMVFIAAIILVGFCVCKFKVRNPHRYSKGYASTNNNTMPPPMVSGEYHSIGSRSSQKEEYDLSQAVKV